eukprot:CAMPEP_0174320348 /NCGR_PEP_ID=MMETSP0810-20121108/9484_1 /TAXON_ID=73025 ORGANISM="Eutreptiella gymnastica-like, Strain CCMP1594" /NCGR_SAMPLE_ID=MMETSP0810 /ASSEMBLY_ACC=CAM_ASM_000659 /LENGTH=181 /DNA_ID=CAMNT_0015431219 /DNA_START=340 /DNA_END=886 /DNA_ORIENTATION=-
MGAALCFPPAKGPAATHAVGPLCVWAPGHFPGGAHTGRSANSPSETCSHSAGHTVCAQAEAEVLGRGAGVAPCAESPGLTAFWRPCKEAMPPTPKRFERMTPEHVALSKVVPMGSSDPVCNLATWGEWLPGARPAHSTLMGLTPPSPTAVQSGSGIPRPSGQAHRTIGNRMTWELQHTAEV